MAGGGLFGLSRNFNVFVLSEISGFKVDKLSRAAFLDVIVKVSFFRASNDCVLSSAPIKNSCKRSFSIASIDSWHFE